MLKYMSMQKLLLALAFGMLLSEPRLGAEGRNPPYGVKLCGREFIRAVIFTCGGSRWRRAGEKGGWGRACMAAGYPMGGEWGLLLGGSVMGRTNPAWPGTGYHRAVRDVMAGLSTSCCKWGCSKSEISSLC
uniref:Relaxin-3 n=1 Tax=Terrapene triunguis TaxID=2587831 RepID=A0A674K6C7_9SAUR